MQCAGFEGGMTFKGATAGVSTANKHGHATLPLDITPVRARSLVTLLIVQIIETLIPFALALTVRTWSDDPALEVRAQGDATPERDERRKIEAQTRDMHSPRGGTRDSDTLSL